MKHIVLVSGGPDSHITLRKVRSLSKTVVPVYCDLGHVYAIQEMKALALTCPEAIVCNVLRGLGEWEDDDAYIPHRNAHLCLAASKYIGDAPQATVWLSVQKDELAVSDRSLEFMVSMSSTLALLTRKSVSIQTPWLSADKTDMVAWFLQSGGAVEELLWTWSCYKGDVRQCGDCPACFRRYVAFSANGIKEKYKQHPLKSPTGLAYKAKALEGTYSPARSRRILAAFGEKTDDHTGGSEG